MKLADAANTAVRYARESGTAWVFQANHADPESWEITRDYAAYVNIVADLPHYKVSYHSLR